jgi:hypothetical protein
MIIIYKSSADYHIFPPSDAIKNSPEGLPVITGIA